MRASVELVDSLISSSPFAYRNCDELFLLRFTCDVANVKKVFRDLQSFLSFCQGYHFSGISGNLEMSGNSAKVRKKLGKRPKVRARSGNLCSQGNLIVAARQNNLPVLYSYCNSFFVRDVHLFDILLAILKCRGFFSVWRVVTGNPVLHVDAIYL